MAAFSPLSCTRGSQEQTEDECAPDLRGHQSRPRPTAIPPALECRSATRFTPRLRAASRSGDDARPPPTPPWRVAHAPSVPPEGVLVKYTWLRIKKRLFRARSQQQYTCRSGAPRLARGRLTMQNRKYSTRDHINGAAAPAARDTNNELPPLARPPTPRGRPESGLAHRRPPQHADPRCTLWQLRP